MPPDNCPNCGADVPRQARACPDCGADDQTGWSENVRQDGLDLPDEDFDYGEFVKKEFGRGGPLPAGISWIWWIMAVLLVLILLRLFLP